MNEVIFGGSPLTEEEKARFREKEEMAKKAIERGKTLVGKLKSYEERRRMEKFAKQYGLPYAEKKTNEQEMFIEWLKENSASEYQEYQSGLKTLPEIAKAHNFTKLAEVV